MAYMIRILRASREYEGSAWASYDAAFRRQAAATGNKRWSKINPSLYSICFTGKAKKVGRCDLCLSAGHPTEECSLGVDDDPGMLRQMKAVELAWWHFQVLPPLVGVVRGVGPKKYAVSLMPNVVTTATVNTTCMS